MSMLCIIITFQAKNSKKLWKQNAVNVFFTFKTLPKAPTKRLNTHHTTLNQLHHHHKTGSSLSASIHPSLIMNEYMNESLYFYIHI